MASSVEVEGKEVEEKKRSRTRPVLGKSGRFLLFLHACGAKLAVLCVNAAAEGVQQRTDMMDRWQNQEVQMKESR